MKTILLMDIVIAGLGIYLAVQAFEMKFSGKISSLVVPQEEIKHCKDTQGYIKAIFPFMLFFALVAFAAGLIGVLCDVKVITVAKAWTYVELLLFLGALSAFTVGMRKAKDKFFGKM